MSASDRMARRVYRGLLWLYPPRFRREFGRDMVQLFVDRHRGFAAAGVSALMRFWLRTIRDVMGQAGLEYAAGLAPRNSPLTSSHAGASGSSGGQTPRSTPQKGLANMMDTLRQDTRYALRSFARSPGFTMIALITLALGIGANTAIFGVINGVLLRPLRFGDPEQLVAVWEHNPAQPAESGESSAGVFVDWRERNRTFADMTIWGVVTFVLQAEDEALSLDGALVYSNFFSVMRINPALGRPFTIDDAEPGRRGSVALISRRLWRDAWGEDPDVIGKVVRIDGNPVEIVGVMESNVAAPDPNVDLWMPYGFRSTVRWDRHSRWLNVYGRLNPAISVQQAQSDLDRISAQLLAGEFSDIYDGWSAQVVPLRDTVVANARPTLIIAFASVGLVLLIACVNIANMLLARAAVRSREIAVRSALGAGRRRIARQLLTESVILGLGGGVIGVAFAKLTHNLILAFEPGIIPRSEELSLDLTALAFGIGVSVLTGVLFGIAPALQGARADLQESLGHGSTRSVTSGRRHNALRAFLVAAQLALTTILLCGAGLLIRSMVELRKVDPGFRAEQTVAARLFLDQSRYRSDTTVAQYFTELTARLSALDGVRSVGASSALPMDPVGINYDLPYRLEGQPRDDAAGTNLPQADFRVVTPGYFESLSVPLLRGRTFTDFDAADAPLVLLVNQTMAEQVWPGQDPVGQRIETPSTSWHWFEVVGVVGDTRYYGLSAEPTAEIYVAHAQVPRTDMSYVIRAEGDMGPLADRIRREVLRQDPGQPTHGIVSIESLVSDTIAAERFYALVLGIFAVVALLLSGAGVYGVLSYWVNHRTQEIGLRMALGADASRVLRLVVIRGMLLAGAGVLVGLAGAFASTRVLSSVLFEVGTHDPVTFIGVAAALGAIALAACWVPAFRASRVDPVVALKQ